MSSQLFFQGNTTLLSLEPQLRVSNLNVILDSIVAFQTLICTSYYITDVTCILTRQCNVNTPSWAHRHYTDLGTKYKYDCLARERQNHSGLQRSNTSSVKVSNKHLGCNYKQIGLSDQNCSHSRRPQGQGTSDRNPCHTWTKFYPMLTRYPNQVDNFGPFTD